jgi:hypothetical protein
VPRHTEDERIRLMYEPVSNEHHYASVRHLVDRDNDGHAMSPGGDTIDHLRSRLSGWHFSKESLTSGEREILYVAERVLDTLDQLAGGYLQ